MLEEFDEPDEQTRTRRSQREGRRERSGARKALIALTLVVGLIVAGVVGFGVFLNQVASSNITRESGLLPAASDTAGGQDGENGQPIPQDVGMNILAIGSDARPGDTASRSDVIVLIHIPEDRSAVYLTHFPRDLYVTIPGRGKDKINAAYAYGGAALLVSTMQELLDIRIDHVAKTDFEGFKDMTDAVGGVRVYAEEASTGRGNAGPIITITKGWNTLDGNAALYFVRERKALSEGDISRGRRQLAWIKAIMLKGLSPDTLTNPVRLTRFVDAGTQNLVVDDTFDMGEMRSMAFSLRGVRASDIAFITAPFTGFGTSPQGASIDIVDEAGMARLGQSLRTDTMDEYADRSVTP